MVSTCAHHLLVLFHTCTLLYSVAFHICTLLYIHVGSAGMTVHSAYAHRLQCALTLSLSLSLHLPSPSLAQLHGCSEIPQSHAHHVQWRSRCRRHGASTGVAWVCVHTYILTHPMPEARRLYRCYLRVCTCTHTHILECIGCVRVDTYLSTCVHSVSVPACILR